MIHATVSPGVQLELPRRSDFNVIAYALEGNGTMGSEVRPITLGQAALFGSGDSLVIGASEQQDSRTPNLEILVFGGQPIGEPIAWHGPFVINTREELIQAFEDY